MQLRHCDCDLRFESRNRKSLAFLKGGGGNGPDPVHVGPPGQRSVADRMLVLCTVFQLFVRVIFAVFFAPCVGCERGLLSIVGPAKRRAQLSGV